MERIKLSIQERKMLSNQNRILALIDQNDADHYNYLAEIVEYGYEGLYPELFGSIDESIPIEISNETHEILTMYRVINNSISKLKKEQLKSIDLEKIEFEGFDGNNDPHYHFMEFIIKKGNLYKEFFDMDRNSHNSWTIKKYRTILEYYKQVKNKGKSELSFEDLKNMVNLI